MYKISFNGLDLHYYGQGAYGWGLVSSITSQPGQLVTFDLRAEAADYIATHRVFCSGATIIDLGTTDRSMHR